MLSPRKLFKSLSHALRGIKIVLTHEHSFRIQVMAAFLVLIAGLLIAGALVYGTGGGTVSTSGGHQGLPNNQRIDDLRPIGVEDHIRGNPEAKVSIIEFSDFECPFCARLHPTLKRIVEENADVRWVYRHFPLSSIHSRAQRAAAASECIAKLGGNEAFWSFADVLFENQRRLGDALYTEEAGKLGISAEAMNVCLSDRSIGKAVSTDYEEAIASGGR